MTEAAVAMVAAAATAAAISFPGSAVVAAFGVRFTGVGVLLPTVFLVLGVLAVFVVGGLEASLEGVDLLSCGLERLGVFVSAVLLGVGFLVATFVFEGGLGVSAFAGFVVEEGRERGASASFFAAGVAGLVSSKKPKTTRKNNVRTKQG